MGHVPPMQLAPFPRPMGIFTPFIATQSETLILQEKVLSLSGNSFDIQLANGQPIFKVKGEWSWSDRTNVMDMTGNLLYCVRKRHLTWHTTFCVENANGEEIFEVQARTKWVGSKFIGSFTSATGQEEKLLMKGDWTDTTAEVTDEASGQQIAAIYRDRWNAREFFGGQQTYYLTVAPNVDMALLVAWCICLDLKKEECKG